jgi:hypothetical protein
MNSTSRLKCAVILFFFFLVDCLITDDFISPVKLAQKRVKLATNCKRIIFNDFDLANMCTKSYKKSNVSVEVEIPIFWGQKWRKREKPTKTGN